MPEYTGSKKRLLFKSGMWSKLNYDDRINIKDYYMRGDRIKLTYDASSCALEIHVNKLWIGPPYISDTFRGMIMYPTVDLINSKV